MKLAAWLISLFILSVPISADAADRSAPTQPALRISVLASGKILINGKENSLPEIKQALEKTRNDKGAVWYYRENPRAEPTSQAMEVVNLSSRTSCRSAFRANQTFQITSMKRVSRNRGNSGYRILLYHDLTANSFHRIQTTTR